MTKIDFIIEYYNYNLYCYRDPEEVAVDLLRNRDQPDQDTDTTI